jgi:hypothetical protein
MEDTGKEIANGAAMAAFLSAGIGSFALGFIVILNTAGLFAVPALYGPAGGVTGRTTLAVVIWLIAWVVLHSRWKDQQIEQRRIHILSLILIGMGILLTFPPVWSVF